MSFYMKKNGPFKSLPARKLPKIDREQAVLMGLIELYLKTGKPVGSQTLQEAGFESLSSATIRNYFGKMESAGYLKQQHTSGGRIPTDKAFRLYADTCKISPVLKEENSEFLTELFTKENRAIASALHRAAERLSEEAQCAIFISSPRFDQDFIQDVRLVALDATQVLSILITDFGLIRTETIYLDDPVDPNFLRSTEEYFRWRMKNGEKPLFRNEFEAKTAQRIYNEVMVRHVVGYANFPVEDVLRAGLSKLLSYPEFNDAAALAKSLSLLEDESQMRSLLGQCAKKNELVAWIGDELCPHVPEGSECAVVAVPYHINQTVIGAIGLLGPMRWPYREIFGLMQAFSSTVSRKLTEQLYKYKISFRQHDSLQLENKPRNS
jgi:heat-inducible transcriptional repressor